MGTTLTGTTPQDTYDSLIKVTDNGPLSATAKRLSDGLGNDSTLYLSTTSVGIGVASPVETLEVGGTTVVKSGSGTTVLAVADTSTGGKQYSLISAGTGNVHSVPTGSFYIRNSTDGVTAMTLTSAGNVGIGTSSPSVRLHVKGTAETGSVLRLEPTTSTTVYSQVVGANGDIQIQADPLNNEGSSAVKMFVDGSEIVRVTSNGLCFNGDFLAANALDDYEEGTWTPAIAFGGASVDLTYTLRYGRYTKIGNQVNLSCYIELSNKGTSTGGCTISGFPFTNGSPSGNYTAPSIWFQRISYANILNGIVSPNATGLSLTEITEAGTLSSITDADFQNTSEIIINLTYAV
jgi:hypothetical protein